MWLTYLLKQESSSCYSLESKQQRAESQSVNFNPNVFRKENTDFVHQCFQNFPVIKRAQVKPPHGHNVAVSSVPSFEGYHSTGSFSGSQSCMCLISHVFVSHFAFRNKHQPFYFRANTAIKKINIINSCTTVTDNVH